MNKKKVILRAPFLSQSGYGIHSRQVARYLLSRPDVDLVTTPVQWGQTPWLLDANDKHGLIGELMSRATSAQGPFDASFQIQLPNEWDPRMARVNVGITAGVETTVCNPQWVKCVNDMTHVVVPTSFVKSTFMKSGNLTGDGELVTVIPESFLDEVADASIPPMHIELSTKFNFLSVGQLTGGDPASDRKNIHNMLKWFCETFSGDADVGLIIKTNSGRDTKIDRQLTTDVIRQVLGAVRKGPYPAVYLLHGAMSDAEVAGLYRHPTVKAFISLSRGEGFGLPILEAAASGLPVIATNWSGYLDFMNMGKFIKLDFELRQLPKSRLDNNIFMPEAKWADVDEHDVKRKLRKFYDSPTIPTQWAMGLKDTIRREFSFQAISKQYDTLWDSLMK